MIVVSIGCPAGVGPEVAVAGARHLKGGVVLVGDAGTIRQAATAAGVAELRPYSPLKPGRRGLRVLPAGPVLSPADRRPGRPTARAGESQLVAIEAAYALAKEQGAPLVTGPVNKAIIARSGLPRARKFKGHTEYLGHLDGVKDPVMCFYSRELTTSLVTTHLPLARVPRALTPEKVCRAIVALAQLVGSLGAVRPELAVASLNPHAGEAGLLGAEEAKSIAPGIDLARKRLGRKVRLTGPIGAETAYRLAHAGRFAGVVAMYHDQATIPMKLVAFGEAVNVTMGLSVVRTSVDHGTGYDIAWRGRADAAGMVAAMKLAERMAAPGAKRR